MRFFVLFMLCASLYFLGQSVLQEENNSSRGDTPRGIPIWTLPEMDKIPQTKDWTANATPLSRRPHISGVLRYFLNGSREILHFSVGVPETVIAI